MPICKESNLYSIKRVQVKPINIPVVFYFDLLKAKSAFIPKDRSWFGSSDLNKQKYLIALAKITGTAM